MRRRAPSAIPLLALAALAALAIAGCGGRGPRGRSSGGEGTTATSTDEAYITGTAGAEATGGSVEETESLAIDREVQPSLQSDSERGTARSEIPAPAAAGASSGGGRDPLVAVPRPEPSPWDGRDWALAPATPQRVLLATIEIPPGDAFRPPATSCQDVIVFVREGQLEATGTGIATSDAPITLYAGDAVRFGPEGDGVAINVGTRPARTVVAVARRPGAGPARVPAPSRDDCAIATGHDDPLRRPLRVASVATTAPIVRADAGLEVRVLLDADGAGAEHGSLSYLHGARDLTIGAHLHPGVAEILLIEDGEGTMRVGGREIAVRAGSALYIPEGVLHSYRSTGTRPLRAIQILSPASPVVATR